MVDFADLGHGIGLKKIKARDPLEAKRNATVLELFFDLVYVIAVAAAAGGLHSNLAHHHVSEGIVEFVLAFLILWNAWSAFTWFASGYDPDDLPYRVAVLFQMFGSLMIAANLNVFFEQGLTWVGVVGYTIMRVASLSQWLRVHYRLTSHAQVASRHIIGLTILQLAWISWLFIPQTWQMPVIFILMFFELTMPTWAHAGRFDSWNPSHIAERYGLLTIIVLGEAVVSSSSILQNFFNNDHLKHYSLFLLGSSTLSLAFALWWLYFNVPFEKILQDKRNRSHLAIFNWLHLVVFASLAGLGSALELVAESLHPIESASLTSDYVIMILGTVLSIFLISIASLRAILCSNKILNSLMALLISLAIVGFGYVAVVQGLELGGGIWIMVLAPICMTVVFIINNNQNNNKLSS